MSRSNSNTIKPFLQASLVAFTMYRISGGVPRAAAVVVVGQEVVLFSHQNNLLSFGHIVKPGVTRR